jgi:hypothetical protein
VDALCFDWRNLEQVQRLLVTPKIFKQAQQVAIVLGDRDDADASAIEFVRKVTSMSRPEVRLSEFISQWSGNDYEWVDCMGVSILHLFQRQWWRRLW